MFERYSYKIKFRALLVLFLLFSILAYRRMVRPMWDNFKEYRQLKEIANAGKTEGDIRDVRADIAQLNRLIGNGGIEKERVQNEIISFISLNGDGTTLAKLESIHDFTENDFTAFTYRVDLVGEMNALLKTLYAFEKKFEYSRVVSAAMYTSTDSNKKTKLHLSIIFQNYEQNK